MLHVKHTPGPFGYDVILTLTPEEEKKALSLRKGQAITYVGILSRWGQIMSHSVTEGRIISQS